MNSKPVNRHIAAWISVLLGISLPICLVTILGQQTITQQVEKAAVGNKTNEQWGLLNSGLQMQLQLKSKNEPFKVSEEIAFAIQIKNASKTTSTFRQTDARRDFEFIFVSPSGDTYSSKRRRGQPDAGEILRSVSIPIEAGQTMQFNVSIGAVSDFLKPGQYVVVSRCRVYDQKDRAIDLESNKIQLRLVAAD